MCSTQYPRTYNISLKDEYEAFKDDFRITSCICILKWLVNNYKTGGEKAVRSPDGKVDVNVIEFALRRCAEFVKSKEHEDIDLPETPTIWEHQWDHFLTQYYKIINEGHILKDCKEDPAIKVRRVAEVRLFGGLNYFVSFHSRLFSLLLLFTGDNHERANNAEFDQATLAPIGHRRDS